jgi:hypothetical protein
MCLCPAAGMDPANGTAPVPGQIHCFCKVRSAFPARPPVASLLLPHLGRSPSRWRRLWGPVTWASPARRDCPPVGPALPALPAKNLRFLVVQGRKGVSPPSRPRTARSLPTYTPHDSLSFPVSGSTLSFSTPISFASCKLTLFCQTDIKIETACSRRWLFAHSSSNEIFLRKVAHQKLSTTQQLQLFKR